MSTVADSWEKIKELFAEALGQAPSSRRDFLRRRCVNSTILAEVYRLLAEHEEAGSFLSKPAMETLRIDENLHLMICRLKEGQLLSGRFRILSFIAAGGMGEVYKAQDTLLDRSVALKFLPPEFASDQASLSRLRAEAMAASALNHPNICTVFDFGEDHERAFIIMEFLEGLTLAERLKTERVTVAETVRIALQVSSALSAAHKKGIIHRDLKPGNIMLTPTGAKLLDFGLAQRHLSIPANQETTEKPPEEELFAGTLPYMSPERLRGHGADARGDIFAFGVVLYEMLTGKWAFKRDSKMGTIEAIFYEEPKPVRVVAKNIPLELESVVRRCLQKAPADRCPSMTEVEDQLQNLAHATRLSPKLILRELQRPKNAIVSLMLLAVIAGGVAWRIHRESQIRWARNEALPQIGALIDQAKIDVAFRLATEAERYIPSDPVLLKDWTAISSSPTIESTPSGASVYYKKYDAPENVWQFLGSTPIHGIRLPLVDTKWRFELKGHSTVESATFPAGSIKAFLLRTGESPKEMVRVNLADSFDGTDEIRLGGLSGYDALEPIPLSSFWIDKFEVTNGEFKAFVDHGGYQKPIYWKYAFSDSHKRLAWPEAMMRFRDRSGQSGPSTWMDGTYPAGQRDFPVTGVSWFEAEAYAEFSGKMLPTVYHWIAAASPLDGVSIIPASNFGSKGLAPVGRYSGLSWSGTFDMAGNAKEWVFNEANANQRYLLGGAWNEPVYMFYNADARSPFERGSTFGFRCANYKLADNQVKAKEPIQFRVRRYDQEKPASDRLFSSYVSLYTYDRTPLKATLERIHETDDWKEEKITFDAAYENERVIAYLFLPKHSKPPFQTIIHFGGAAAFFFRSSEPLDPSLMSDFDFLIKAGRAVMFPVYKGTFERRNDFMSFPKTSASYRDGIIDCAKDLRRSVDYLETRPDIDSQHLAYEGKSLGAALGAIMLAVEHRFKVAVLISPGFYLQARRPEVDQFNFAPRVETPVLMVNGTYDNIFPVGLSQEPMFRLLGSRNDLKRRVVYDVGHDIPRADEIRESNAWLDKYLGSVKRY